MLCTLWYIVIFGGCCLGADFFEHNNIVHNTNENGNSFNLSTQLQRADINAQDLKNIFPGDATMHVLANSIKPIHTKFDNQGKFNHQKKPTKKEKNKETPFMLSEYLSRFGVSKSKPQTLSASLGMKSMTRLEEKMFDKLPQHTKTMINSLYNLESTPRMSNLNEQEMKHRMMKSLMKQEHALMSHLPTQPPYVNALTEEIFADWPYVAIVNYALPTIGSFAMT